MWKYRLYADGTVNSNRIYYVSLKPVGKIEVPVGVILLR